jgi:hypothetical protein
MLHAPQVRRVSRASKSKIAHIVQIRHRDEVEAPFTDWLAEAYAWSEAKPARPAGRQSAAAAKRPPATPRGTARAARTSRPSAKRKRR